MYGGKRRTRRRGLRGGAGYGAGGAIAPGAMQWDAAYTGPVNSAGAAVPDPTDPAGGYTGVGGRRRRGGQESDMYPGPPLTPMMPAKGGKKSRRKGGKKSRKGSRKGKMRGGASQVSMGTVGYGYTGTGAGGLADATQYTTQGNAF